MSTVTINLPGLSAAAAKDLVNMALNEWRASRDREDYVEQRYPHMSGEFRALRRERLGTELRALDNSSITTKETP